MLGDAVGGGRGGGLTGMAAATSCALSCLLACSLPSRIGARCSSSSSVPGIVTTCHRLPGAGERVVGRYRFGTGGNTDD
ncbi:MAG: hypothetical protein ACKO96_07055, partial [Flammeovirgaceae bacterium]